jgi:hypothetical protein
MESIRKSLKEMEICEVQVHGSLAMLPLLATAEGNADYLLLGDALRSGLALVSEVSEAGHVPELKFSNSADLPVLIFEGEELVGAKQNRTTNLTILAPARTTIVIPVTCVEAGRWHYATRDAQVSERVHVASARAAKAATVSDCLYQEGAPYADQTRVWHDIGCAAQSLGVHSPTRAMSDIFETHRSRIDEYVAAFRAVDRQVGALFEIAGEPAGFDLFAHGSTLRAMLPKLVRSYAVDAMRAAEGDGPTPDGARARAFLDAVATATVESYPAVGLGTTIRLSSGGLVGGGLVHDDRLVHLAAFAVERESTTHRDKGRGLANLSTRRRSYRR